MRHWECYTSQQRFVGFFFFLVCSRFQVDGGGQPERVLQGTRLFGMRAGRSGLSVLQPACSQWSRQHTCGPSASVLFALTPRMLSPSTTHLSSSPSSSSRCSQSPLNLVGFFLFFFIFHSMAVLRLSALFSMDHNFQNEHHVALEQT